MGTNDNGRAERLAAAGRRAAWRAAMRGLTWLLSKKARTAGFDVGRVFRHEGLLDVSRGDRCPLALAAGIASTPSSFTYTDATSMVQGVVGNDVEVDTVWLSRHGFETGFDGRYGYDELTDAWRTLLTAHYEMVGG